MSNPKEKTQPTKRNRVALTNGEKNWLIEKINAFNPSFACTFCGNETHEIAGSLVHPVEVLIKDNKQYATPISGSVYPTLQVFCSNCGKVELFNTNALGFTPEDLEDTDSE